LAEAAPGAAARSLPSPFPFSLSFRTACSLHGGGGMEAARRRARLGAERRRASLGTERAAAGPQRGEAAVGGTAGRRSGALAAGQGPEPTLFIYFPFFLLFFLYEKSFFTKKNFSIFL